MRRRTFLRRGAQASTLLISELVIAPVGAALPALLGVAIFIAIRRYYVEPFLALLARLFPNFFGSELRRYLIAVALKFGFDKVHAAVLAEHAEERGAIELAKDGQTMRTEIRIQNNRDTALGLTGLSLLLVDVVTNTVDVRSASRWGIVVSARETSVREISASNFPKQGLKRWYLVDRTHTLVISEVFMVVA